MAEEEALGRSAKVGRKGAGRKAIAGLRSLKALFSQDGCFHLWPSRLPRGARINSIITIIIITIIIIIISSSSIAINSIIALRVSKAGRLRRPGTYIASIVLLLLLLL